MVVQAIPVAGAALAAGGVGAGAAGAGAAAAGAGAAGGLLGGGFWQQIAGQAIGGGLGGMFGGLGSMIGGGGRTGALEDLLQAVSASQKWAVDNFERNFPRFHQAFRASQPGYQALESRVLSDLSDPDRTARLESAFQRRLQQQQSALGLMRSPTSALRTSFAGLQFNEDMRQRAFDNAMGFQAGLAQPLATGFFQSGLAPISEDTGFQNTALRLGRQQMIRESIVGGFNEGVGLVQRLQGLNEE
jgi:hypothetical protein